MTTSSRQQTGKTTGVRWLVRDSQGKEADRGYRTRTGAQRAADKRDAEYGAVRFVVVPADIAQTEEDTEKDRRQTCDACGGPRKVPETAVCRELTFLGADGREQTALVCDACADDAGDGGTRPDTTTGSGGNPPMRTPNRPKMTIAKAKAHLRTLGVTLWRDGYLDEYRVSLTGDGPDKAYHTSDLADAIATGETMAHTAAGYDDLLWPDADTDVVLATRARQTGADPETLEAEMREAMGDTSGFIPETPEPDSQQADRPGEATATERPTSSKEDK